VCAVAVIDPDVEGYATRATVRISRQATARAAMAGIAAKT
jgi:hypothetical protein